MLKTIKKWGHSLVIRFSPEEVKIHELEENKIVDVELYDVEKVEGGKDGNIHKEN